MPQKQMTFGQLARFMREEAGLTIAEVADLVGVSTATIVYFEKDSRDLSEKTLRKLFIHLNRAVDERRRRIEEFCGSLSNAIEKGQLDTSIISVSAKSLKDALIGSAA